MVTKAEYHQKLEAQVSAWQAEIDRLKTRGRAAKDADKDMIQSEVEALQKGRDACRERLIELEQASEDTWEALKDGLEELWHEIGDAIGAAAEKFK